MLFSNRKIKTRLNKIFSGILIAVYLSSVVVPGAVFATTEQVGEKQFPAAKHEPKRGRNPETGKVSFIGGGDPIFVPGVSDVAGLSPEERAKGMANAYSKDFGLKNPSQELKLLKSKKDGNGKDVVRFQQLYEGVPILAGELIVNMNAEGELLSMSGEVSSDLTLDTKPDIQAPDARKTALSEIASSYQIDEKELIATQPELWIFDESILTASTRPVELVWRTEVTAKDISQPIREMVLVNAQTGEVSFHINQADTAHVHSETAEPIKESQQLLPATIASQIQYVDLVVDEPRGKLYGADKTGNKIDVIDLSDLSVVGSYTLAPGALPNGIDLSPDRNELAVAQSGFRRVAFVNLIDSTISETSTLLSGNSSKATDVIYGRSGILYALSTHGLHVINLTVTPHIEYTSQYVQANSFEERLGAISSDKNTLYYVTGTCCSGANELYKFNVSAGLSKPTQLGFTYLYQSQYQTNIRLSLADDGTLLTAWGSIYDTATLTLKAKNGQNLQPVSALPGRSFYAVAYDSPADPDALYFFDEESSHQLTSLDTGISGTPGAMATTSDGNNLFVSSTGGMTKFEIGATPPGEAVSLPQSLHQYRDFVFDMPRGVIYGTDASGRVDVIDQATGTVVNSYLLRNGANPMGIDLSPDGSELAIALNSLEAILFLNPETGTEIAKVTPKVNFQTNLPEDVIYGRAGRLYSVEDSYIQVFDTVAHTWINRSYYPSPQDLAITIDNKYIYSNATYSDREMYIFDVQTDAVTRLYRSADGTSAEKFDISPDGSKVFTSGGQVWSRDIQEQIGTLEGTPGSLIEYIPGKDAVALAVGNMIKFISADDYHLISTHTPAYPGTILEMEVAPDGSKLIAHFSGSENFILDISTVLPNPPQIPVSSTIKYEDLVVDEMRGKLYGADKAGSKIDVISMEDMSVVNSYSLALNAWPTGLDLSPDGNELAVAQSGLNYVAFINLTDGTTSQTAALTNTYYVYDVLYGRPNILYALSNNGIHTINASALPHTEDVTQYVTNSLNQMFGVISSDKNTLYFIGDGSLHKFNVSAGLPKPTELASTGLYNAGNQNNLRISLADDSTLLTSWGSIYDAATLILKAQNAQSLMPVSALPGRDFYAVTFNTISQQDVLYFFDEEKSYKQSSFSTGMIGTPGAMAVTNDGNMLFVSSTGGMTKFEIGNTPPGTPISLPQSLRQYRDFAFDMPHGLIYATDASNRIDVINQNTGSVVTSYLLPNGADPIGIDFSPDSMELAIALSGLEKFIFINSETGAFIAQVIPPTGRLFPYDVIYGRAGRLYAVGYGALTDYLHVIDSSTHTWLNRSTYPNTPAETELALTSDNKYLYANKASAGYVFDVQTDALTLSSSGHVDNGLPYKFTIIPDGSKMFTNYGEVWSSNLKEQRGTLEGGAGSLIKYIHGQGTVVVAGQDVNGSVLKFISTNTHRLLTTYRPTNAGTILEIEISPDGSKLIANFSSGDILLLSISTILPVPPSPPTPALSTIKYDDLIVDQARGKLYGADKAGSKIDVIDMSNMHVTSSYELVYGALPTGLDLSPDGNELAVAQSGLSRVAFINLNNGTILEIPAPLNGSIGIDPANPFDVLYGRSGNLYALSRKGLHTINTLLVPHAEDTTQYVNRTSNDKFGVISSDKNTLFFTAGSPLFKFNVSAGLTKPTQLSSIYLDDTSSKNNVRLSLADDNTLLTSWGNIYDTSLILKAKNGRRLMPVIPLPGRSFYAVAYDDPSNSDSLHFFDEQTSHQLSSLSTSVNGIPGAMAVTGDGNTLFVSSTGGMTSFEIGITPPGDVSSPPQSLQQYRDFAFDMERGVIYGTDVSGRVDVIDQDTGTVVNSYLLPNGASPIGIDLRPDGNELAVAMNGLESILFLNPETGMVIARVKPLNSSDSNLPYDVIYGRSGRLYSGGNPGSAGIDYIHAFDTTTHTWLAKSSRSMRTGAELLVTADKKYLYANETFSPNNIYVFDVQTDTITNLYEGPHGPVLASRFTIEPDGTKVFTSGGQVWSGNMQTQLGTLQGGSGMLIKYIPGENAIALTIGNLIKFVSATNYQLLSSYSLESTEGVLEMEVAPDGSKLVINHPGEIFILDLTTFPPPTPTPLPTSTFGPGPSPTPRPSSTPGPSPTPVSPSFTGNRRTYTASGGWVLPGTFLCDENQSVCTNGGDLDADEAHQYAADTFVFYNTQHQRNSIDDAGSTITSTVNFGINYQNAFWNGSEVVYGDNMAADDIVGHEITHGVTEYTSGLIYYAQSGAINESFSDVWGEFIDQTNGSGNDSPSVKWLLAEDSALNVIRSMSNPPTYGHPDKISSSYFYIGSGDNGGVHINSGVNNKAAYLMVEGDTFNGKTIAGIGLDKTAAVYYEAQVYHLTMGANYNDLYFALIQACQNLIGGADGITQNDCDQVRLAAEAVEMIPPPPPTPTPTATLTNTSTATATPSQTPTYTPTNTPTHTPTPTNTLTPTAIPPYSYNPLYLSLTGNQTIGGVASADEDILKFDGTNWSLFFDGSDVGVGSSDLFGFSIVDADTILLAFSSAVTVNGLTVNPQDVVRFESTSLGSVTSGTFSMYLDGSDVGLDTTAEKIDSVSLLSDGRVLISTTGNPAVVGVTGGRDEDVLAFTPTSLGDVTSGAWAMYFDGSDVGLGETSGEDVDALDVVAGKIYLSTVDNFTVSGIAGADEDVFVCVPISLGDVTACSYLSALYFDGSTWGLTANDVDAFNFLAAGSVPTVTPSITPSITPSPTRTLTPTVSVTPTRTAAITSTFTNTPTLTTITPTSQLLPDLTITSMRIELQNTSCFSPGDPLGVRVWVTNNGQAAAGNFVVNVNGMEQTVNGLGISETKTVFFPGASNPVNAVVDSTGMVAESNESNNSRSETLPVPTPPLPCPTATFTPTQTLTPVATFTPTFTNTPSSSDLIFADGFESGNFSAWTANTNDLGDLSVSASAALVGTQGMQAVVDDTNTIYVTDDSPNAEPRYRARFYFDPNSITMASGDAHFIFKGFMATGADVLQVELRNSAGVYQIRGKLLNDASAFVVTNWFNLSDAPHAIEVDWRAATAVGANNGGLTLWIDGVQQADVTGVDNDTWRIDRARLGALAGMDAGTSGTYYFDAFESRRQNYIGP